MKLLFEDQGIQLTLMEHINADLLGNRNPEDEPDFLVSVVAFLVDELKEEAQKRLAATLGYKLVE